ncbi:bacillithiol biosynthesis deacetylase BshB1 [Priestia koreensis]|uniref:bacillithiol biosynthesis deacetylase BshB1 n=1 Tax=Priestia koreensis TaxID=284581 RepID=UPI001F585831|nr:bacillithiol biosynthesis deacetylase BshB1 [Priestia koreensis]UNL86012.1 bacillithiol biosynthesis deacetylase BshB1 [Priestia koreensis]
MSIQKLDVLAFGAHADDVEIGMGGTIAKMVESGLKVGICDLTHAELSSNGTVDIRKEEAANAAAILGVEERVHLHIPDRGLFLTADYIREVASIIRKYQPRLVFAPYFEDRHPDHGNCARLVEEAAFSAGVKNYRDDHDQPAHRIEALHFYVINGFQKPHFAVDVSTTFEKKRASLNAYESQFVQTETTFTTPLVNGYIETVESRDRLVGKEVGVLYAEGFLTKKPLLLHADLIGGQE